MYLHDFLEYFKNGELRSQEEFRLLKIAKEHNELLNVLFNSKIINFYYDEFGLTMGEAHDNYYDLPLNGNICKELSALFLKISSEVS